MKVGIYVTSLAPAGASQARFQSCVFEGLLLHNHERHQFVVFCDDIPQRPKNTPLLTFVELYKDGHWKRFTDLLRKLGARLGTAILTCAGASKGNAMALISNYGKTEPAYYSQLRSHQIRIIWNVSGHELRSWLPYIKTVWDVNHRIHSMFPEFSYTRFTFDGLDLPLLRSLPKASYLITGTAEGKRQIVSLFGVSEYKVRIIPFPTPPLPKNVNNQVAKLTFKIAAPYLFYPARLWPHKNHAVIIAALHVLREKWGIQVNLVLSGADEGNLGHIMEYADTLHVAAQVEYVGKVDDLELVTLYEGALALVYASAVGPDNLPPLEAMSLRCPAIVAEVPGAREQYGDACLYFKPTDEQELATLVKLILEDSAVRKALIAKGEVRAKKWSVNDYAGAIVNILNEFELVARAWGRNDAPFT